MVYSSVAFAVSLSKIFIMVKKSQKPVLMKLGKTENLKTLVGVSKNLEKTTTGQSLLKDINHLNDMIFTIKVADFTGKESKEVTILG